HRSGLGIDHDVGVGRVVAFSDMLSRLGVVDRASMVVLAPRARIGGIAGGRKRCEDGGETQTAPTEPTSGSGRYAMHVAFPRSRPSRASAGRLGPLFCPTR